MSVSRTSGTKKGKSNNNVSKTVKKSTGSSSTNKKNVTKSKKNERVNDLTTVYMPNKNVNINKKEEREYNSTKKEQKKISKPKNEVPKKEVDIQKRNKRVKFVLSITFLLAIITSSLYLMLNLEIFNLKEIKVQGNQKYDSTEIIKKSTLEVGKNIFIQIVDSSKNEIGLSYISSCKLKIEFPNIIVIEVNERYPSYLAYDSNTSKYYKIDNEGYLLEETTLLMKKDDEVLVEGLYFSDGIVMGERINDTYMSKIEVYNNIKKAITDGGINGKITKVSFVNSLTTITLDDKLNIVFPNDNNLKYKIGFLKGIIANQGGITEGKIDMSTENPVFSMYN